MAVVAQRFSAAWRTSISAWGQPLLPSVTIPHVVAGQNHDLIRSMIDEQIDGIVRGLLDPVREPAAAPGANGALGSVTVGGDDFLSTVEAVNSLFLDRGWGDGFPVVPPTPEAVERMLGGTKRDPQDVVSIMEPGFGIATVEKLAVNAVMAGCRPEHLPVLIAAVEALAEPDCILREMQVSTVPEAPLMIVNGPIAKRLGINAGTTAMGPGAINYANTVIGRSLRLSLMNIGDCYAGEADINTMGLPTKYSMCIAENEDASPWSPYHVDKGYRPRESTVTVVAVSGVGSIVDVSSTRPETILDVAASALHFTGSAPSGDWLRGGKINPGTNKKVLAQHTLLVAPDHARIMAQAGWDKADVRNYLHRTARLPFKTLYGDGNIKRDKLGNWYERPDLQWLENYPDVEVPIAASPDSFIVAVAGGLGNVSEFFWGIYGSATKAIEA